jgi:ABC-type Fe3+-citrate transport system substrate-binding protein
MLEVPNLPIMKNSTRQQNSFKIICDIIGHKYEVSKQVTSHVKEYTCKCCKKQLTTNSNGHLTELTPKFKEINSILEEIYTRRMLRSKAKPITSSIY